MKLRGRRPTRCLGRLRAGTARRRLEGHRPQTQEQPRLLARLAVRVDRRHRLGTAAQVLPQLQVALRYVQLHGINWDQVLLDGSKKPSKEGGKTPDHRRWIVVSPVRLSI